ncbi:MAG TPA: TIGR04282 family arsenosugar biosynthesis glycosyltransferase [Chloroflexota bacterium]|nr:TIGR04282 family arsenosugar biosynthesis glycosyltransferase [Chloroflexota bacterium]
MAKAPRAGQAKTRLCPPLTPDQSARLAAAFLQDTVTLAQRAGVDVRLICRDEEERAALIAGDAGRAGAVTVYIQHGSGLGAALESAFVQGLADGYQAVAVLGADTPTLPPAIVAEAFAALRSDVDVALGSSNDGGYYLLAASRLYPQLFRDMTWSTSQVAAETLRRCAALNLRTHLLPEWSDVDDAAALARLIVQLDTKTIGPDVASHTRAALNELPVPTADALAGTLTGSPAVPVAAATAALSGKDRS